MKWTHRNPRERVTFPYFVTDTESRLRHVSREMLNAVPDHRAPRQLRAARREARRRAMLLRARRGRR